MKNNKGKLRQNNKVLKGFSMSKKASNRGVAWLHSEVNALLDIWADQEIQEQLAGRLHNMCIYDKISRKLKDLGFDRTGEQCREKIKKLRRDYKTVVDNNYSPAFARRLLGFYDKVHKLFGKPSSQKQLSDIETNVQNVLSESLKEDNSDVFQSDSDMELSVSSFTNNINMPENIFTENTTDDKNNTELLKNNNNESDVSDKSTEDEMMFQTIYQQYTLLQESLKIRQDLINTKLLEFYENFFENELQRKKQRLLSLEIQRHRTKSQELNLHKTLLQFLAHQKGVNINFNETTT